jgi:hypothetical protein
MYAILNRVSDRLGKALDAGTDDDKRLSADLAVKKTYWRIAGRGRQETIAAREEARHIKRYHDVGTKNEMLTTPRDRLKDDHESDYKAHDAMFDEGVMAFQVASDTFTQGIMLPETDAMNVSAAITMLEAAGSQFSSAKAAFEVAAKGYREIADVPKGAELM